MANINTGHLLLLTACYTIYVHSVPVFRDCGGRLTDAKGVIQSPNFPKEFPTPIQCEWVIYNPQTRNTAIYLTQFYLKGFVSVWQFEHYSNQREYINPRQLATLNANSEIQHIVSNKPYTVIRLAVSEINDINVRVLDHIVDVYGFNITYEFLDRSSTNLKRTCSINLCSYLATATPTPTSRPTGATVLRATRGIFVNMGNTVTQPRELTNARMEGNVGIFMEQMLTSVTVPKGSQDTCVRCPSPTIYQTHVPTLDAVRHALTACLATNSAHVTKTSD